jgi:hypothetical protein
MRVFRSFFNHFISIKIENKNIFIYLKKMTRRFNELKIKALHDECEEAIQNYNTKFMSSPMYHEYKLAVEANDKVVTNYEKILTRRMPTEKENDEYQQSCDYVDQLLLKIENSIPEYEVKEQAIKNRLDFLIKIGC